MTQTIATNKLTDMSRTDVEATGEGGALEEWKPQRKELFIMISLSFISLMVALDATILVTVLPVVSP
jgi:hypothetical protein